ncbi:Trihelix transcription factor ASIL2 [Glycine max]|nr:Trihelix transcription factor ASIL2 [Glycine max]
MDHKINFFSPNEFPFGLTLFTTLPFLNPVDTFALATVLTFTTLTGDGAQSQRHHSQRNNLKATHWQEVTDAIASRCPSASPPKTPIQCCHKMEKLRKRYRTEIQHIRSFHVSRFNSSLVHFKLMDSMEKGPSPVKPENDSDNSDNDNEDDDDDQDLYPEINHNGHIRSLNNMYSPFSITLYFHLSNS